MAAEAMVKNFGGKKRPPKFEDEGPPSGDDQGRGSGAGAGDEDISTPEMPDADDGDMGGDDTPMPDGADPGQEAVDTLCDMVGIGPQDRDDFANALQAYVSDCIAKSMAPDMGDVGGSPDMGGGPPEEEV